MNIFFKIDLKKALNFILYVSENYPTFNIYLISLLIYSADKKHLLSYGSPIIGDNYIAMKCGPIPSTVYDIIRISRGYDVIFDKDFVKLVRDSLAINNNMIQIKIQSDQDYFSKIEKEIVKKYGDFFIGKTFEQARNCTCDRAYNKTIQNDLISYGDILDESEHKDEILAYIKEYTL